MNKLKGNRDTPTALSDRYSSQPQNIVFLLLFSCVVYMFSLPGDFVYDDVAITVVENPFLSGEATVAEVLTWDRPLREFTYYFDHMIWGLNPVGYHLQNIVWHCANGLLIYWFFILMGIQVSSAFGIAFLFAVHPINTEAVAWISGRKELLCLFFELSVCITFMYSVFSENIQAGHRRIVYGISILSTLLALLSKQVAIALPFLLLISGWFYSEQHHKSFSTSNLVKAVLPHLLLTICFSLWSYRIFEELGNVGERGTFYDPAARDVGYTWISALLTPFATLAKSVWLFLWPMDLTIERGFLPVTSFSDIRWIFGFILVVLFLIEAYKTYGKKLLFSLSKGRLRLPLVPGDKKPVILFSGLWFFLTWAPVSGAVPVGYLLADRYLYIPALGLCALAVVGFIQLHEISFQMLPRALNDKFIPILVFLIFLFLPLRTIVRTFDWNSEVSLWQSAVKARPDHAKARFNLGNAYRDAGAIEAAYRQWHKALRLQPNYPQVWVTIGNAEKRRNRLDEAKQCYHKALEFAPTYGLAHFNLARLYEAQEKPDAALHHYQLAAEYLYGKRTENRWKGLAHYHIACLLFEKNEQVQALQHLRRAMQLAPNHAPIYLLLGMLQQDQPNVARTAFETAIRLDPSYAEAYYNLGVLEWQLGRETEAYKHWEQALEYNPNLQTRIESLMNP